MERVARISRLVDEGDKYSSSSFESRRDITTKVLAPGMSTVDSSLARKPLKSGILDSEDTVETKRDRAPEELHRYKIDNEQLVKLTFEKHDVMKAMSTFIQAMDKEFDTIETEKELLSKLKSGLLAMQDAKQLQVPKRKRALLILFP